MCVCVCVCVCEREREREREGLEGINLQKSTKQPDFTLQQKSIQMLPEDGLTLKPFSPVMHQQAEYYFQNQTLLAATRLGWI